MVLGHRGGIKIIPEEKEEIIKFLVEKTAYPVCSKTREIFLSKLKKDDGFEGIKEKKNRKVGTENRREL